MLFQNICYAESSAETEATAKYVLSQVPEPTISSIGGEWAVIGIKQSGIAVPNNYYNDYIARASGIIERENSSLGRKYTEYSRLAIALSGLDMPSTISGYDLFSYINDYDSVIRTGINGPIFALIAKHYCGDNNTIVTKQYLDYITNSQNIDGSLGLSEGDSDVDITAMAISALTFFQDQPDISMAINRAFLYLSSVQKPDGSFSECPTKQDMDTPTSESTAQVIIAMKRHGLSPNNGFFNKNGNTPLSALNKFRSDDGGYKHTLAETTNNQISSEQALLALTEPQSDITVLMYDMLWFESNRDYLQNIN